MVVTRKELWKISRYLPALSVVLALILAVWGDTQTKRYVGSSVVFDYIAPAEKLLHVLNMPAAVLICTLTRNGAFHLGLEYSIPLFILYLFLIAVMWLLIGQRIAKGRHSFHSVSTMGKSLRLAGLLYGIFMVVVSVAMWGGAQPLILPLASIAWGVLIIVLSI
jgi:hypothetical protein